MKQNWHFQRGGGVETEKTLCERGVDIFWNNTIHLLALVVGRLDNAIHRINRFPTDSVVGFTNTYSLGCDSSGG